MAFVKAKMNGEYFSLIRKWRKSRTSRGLLLAAGVLAITFAPSCQKYEEGPLLSFRSPEKRITNHWTVEYAENLAKAKNVTNKFNNVNYSLRIKKDNSFELTYNASGRTNGPQKRKITGTWQFVNNEKQVSWDFQGYDPYGFLGNRGETTLILKLKKNELWMKNLVNDIELHLKPL